MVRSRRSAASGRSTQWLPLLAAIGASAAAAQTTERASVATDGSEANHHVFAPAVSCDGRFVAFLTTASSLVPGDTNGAGDVFVRDRLTGVTERVSLTSTGGEANGGCEGLAISADGRFVAFGSNATNLVPIPMNGVTHVYVRDRLAGTTELVSVANDGSQGLAPSREPAISADGRFVAFHGESTNLAPGDGNGSNDVFVRDRLAGTTELVSRSTGGAQGNLHSLHPTLSADGRFVAFHSSASNLVTGDTNLEFDAFVRDRLAGTTQRVSVSTTGAQANQGCWYPSISADGRWVAFFSSSTTLVAGEANFAQDVFLRDRLDATTERVSIASSGHQSNGECSWASISADGRFVAFESTASNLVVPDLPYRDVYVRDRLAAATTRANVSGAGDPAQDHTSDHPSISCDGRVVAFASYASNLVPGDTNIAADVFVRDLGATPILAGCFGDGSGAACPCGNAGAPGRGCENSGSTGGALLSASGAPALSSDTLLLGVTGELPSSPTILLQGTEAVAPTPFGDGLRCAGGQLRRLYVFAATGGGLTIPQPGDPSISARSAELGDPIPLGATRHYQTYYRDPDAVFCPPPAGSSWNASNALSAVWGP